ncbi:MAG: CPBP family glutamic-type intramembrane protease, partial [Candidatus Omnitrophota bacterium]
SQLTSLASNLSIASEAIATHLLSSLIPSQLVVDVAEAGGRVTADVVNELKAYPALSAIVSDVKATQPKTISVNIKVEELSDLIAQIASQQKVTPSRMSAIFINSIEPTVFVEGLAKIASIDTKSLASMLSNYPALTLIATTYRLQHLDKEATGKEITLKAEDVVNPEALKYMEDTARISLTFPEAGLKVDSGKWQAVKDHLDAVANDTAQREYNYRSNVLEYFFNKFVPQEARAYAELIRKEFINKGKSLKYLISSGIGANEMFSHLLSSLHNAFGASGIKWVVVDAPADLRLIPLDANDDNTIVIEFSRSGTTQETLKIAELTQNRFTKRIVYANKGPLKSLALNLQKQGKPVIVRNIESTIGGRLMRRLTPMTYGPMLLSGMNPVTYAAKTDTYDKQLDFKNKDKSLAVALARFFFVWVVLGGRREINVMYNQRQFLRHSLYELRQFVMEGANKKSSYPLIAHMNEFARDPHVSMEGVFGQANSQIAFAVVAKKSGFPEDERTLSEEDALNKQHANLSINDMEYSFAYPNVVKSQKVMPTAYIEIDKMTPEVAAGLSSLYEDFIVHYCAITGQDPNSNPQVKAVREGTEATLVKMASQKKEQTQKETPEEQDLSDHQAIDSLHLGQLQPHELILTKKNIAVATILVLLGLVMFLAWMITIAAALFAFSQGSVPFLFYIRLIADSFFLPMGILGTYFVWKNYKKDIASGQPAQYTRVWRQTLLWTILLTLFAIAAILVSAYFNIFIYSAPDKEIIDFSMILSSAISAVLIVPILEEFIFKGGFYNLFKKLLPGSIGKVVATMIVATIFAAMHYPRMALMGVSSVSVLSTGLMMLFVLGVITTLAYEKSGSILAPISIHMFYNFFVVGTGIIIMQSLGNPAVAWFWVSFILTLLTAYAFSHIAGIIRHFVQTNPQQKASKNLTKGKIALASNKVSSPAPMLSRLALKDIPTVNLPSRQSQLKARAPPSSKPAEKLSALKTSFELPVSGMKSIVTSFIEDMKLGLSGQPSAFGKDGVGRQQSSLAMLPAFV